MIFAVGLSLVMSILRIVCTSSVRSHQIIPKYCIAAGSYIHLFSFLSSLTFHPKIMDNTITFKHTKFFYQFKICIRKTKFIEWMLRRLISIMSSVNDKYMYPECQKLKKYSLLILKNCDIMYNNVLNKCQI